MNKIMESISSGRRILITNLDMFKFDLHSSLAIDKIDSKISKFNSMFHIKDLAPQALPFGFDALARAKKTSNFVPTPRPNQRTRSFPAPPALPSTSAGAKMKEDGRSRKVEN